MVFCFDAYGHYGRPKPNIGKYSEDISNRRRTLMITGHPTEFSRGNYLALYRVYNTRVTIVTKRCSLGARACKRKCEGVFFFKRSQIKLFVIFIFLIKIVARLIDIAFCRWKRLIMIFFPYYTLSGHNMFIINTLTFRTIFRVERLRYGL